MSDTFRPQATGPKIHSSQEFELCYLRHQYFRRTTYNPTPAEMAPFTSIATRLARNTYLIYQSLFDIVGLDMEDVVSNAHVQVVSFIGLFEITKDPVKYERFVCAHQKKFTKDPGPPDIMDKNKANMTIFLKQRMQDMVRVCQQKARNIRGKPVDEFFAYRGLNTLPAICLLYLEERNEKYGYKKIDVATFKSARKKAKPKNDRWFKHNGMWYIAISVDHRPLELTDLSGADFDPRDNYHNMDPERIIQEREEIVQYENKRNNFQLLQVAQKKVVFKAFIRDNKRNKRYCEEVETARKFLLQMGK